MIHSRILGTGSYIPENKVTNDDLAKTLDTSDEWIFSRTGIKARHIAAENQNTSDLAVIAAQRALEDAKIDKSQIDLIIVATSTPDIIFPSTACIVQEKLGLNNFPAFDVQAVCAGFMYALVTAHAYIKSGMAKNVLVIGADTFSHIMDWTDRASCVLFGDGAGAVVLSASEEEGIIHSKLTADGRYQGMLCTPGQVVKGKVTGSPFFYMDGPAVFKFAVKALAKVAEEVLTEANFPQEKVDWLVPHQANIRIIETTAKHIGLSMDKVIVTLSEQGNTSAASIPLALDIGIKEGKIKRGQHLLLEGIGGGFAWGAVLLKY